MESPGDHLDLAGHPSRGEALGVGEILVVEQIIGADADPRRGQPAQIVAAAGNRFLRPNGYAKQAVY